MPNEDYVMLCYVMFRISGVRWGRGERMVWVAKNVKKIQCSNEYIFLTCNDLMAQTQIYCFR